MSTENIVIRVIEPNDCEKIIEFLWNNFFRQEPLTMSMDQKQKRVSNLGDIMKHIVDGTCLMAVEQSEKDEVILGVITAGPIYQNEANSLFEKAAKEGPSKLGLIFQFLACVKRDANVFEKYGVSKSLHIYMSCVDENQRGRSISVRLKKELMVLGRNLGYPLMTADSTSFYSARINEKLGMECVYSLRYDEYLDKEGKPIFTPPAPHECVKAFAIRL